MAYESSLLLPPDYEAARNHGTAGDTYYPQDNGVLVRPYVDNESLFYEEDLGIPPEEEDLYDPLTAPLDEVIDTEYGSFAEYSSQSTIWDRQAEDTYQEQRAHGEALARTIAFQSMKRVSEYRAAFPKDTDTLQLRIVMPEPEPSSVDVALAELRQLRNEIAYEKAHPPMFAAVSSLRTKQYETVRPPSDVDAGPAAHGGPSSANTAEAVSTGSLPTASPATDAVREPARSSEALATQPAESELAGGSTGTEDTGIRTRLGKLKALSAHGARKFISRITRQAVLWG